MSGFLELRRVLQDANDVDSLPLPKVIGPFFAIIRSPLSTGPITSSALSALHSFFMCGIITKDSKDVEVALAELSHTVAHCKFEASDSSGDEVVLLKIMTVISDCLCSDVGMVLGDVEVCEMLETVLTTCCQMRLSEILRRTAERVMDSLVRSVFSRLHTLDPGAEEAKLRTNQETVEVDVKMSISQPMPLSEPTPPTDTVAPFNEKPAIEHDEPSTPSSPSTTTHIPVPFGLPSILELLRVLINVLDPSDQQHTDSTRLTALRILKSALEQSGSAILNFPSLEALIVDPGCKFLFLLARSDNSSVLQLALRTISTMFDCLRKKLKLQQELFLAFTMDRLAPPIIPGGKNKALQSAAAKRSNTSSPRPGTPGTPMLPPPENDQGEKSAPTRILVTPARGETRDLVLETLSLFSRYPSFMVDLFVNYDCDINCENLFERLLEFLTKSVYPSEAAYSVTQQQNVQYLCLEMLLAFVKDMASRATGDVETWPEDYTTPQVLLDTKSRKQIVRTGATRFNTKPKTGLTFLEENKLIYHDLSPEVSKEQSLAAFLKSCNALDKKLLGDFISKPDHLELLRAFIGQFDFQNKSVADALRDLLESFRLPGESQQINRITETFASVYFASGPAEIKSEDAVYVLAYSVIMLNVDQHSPHIRKRMAFEDYQRNLRGVNDGSDFPLDYLHGVYDSIRKQEIVMPEEHSGQIGFEHAWKELLARSRQTGDLMICNTSAFDIEMFKLVWKPVISAIAYAFISFDDEYIIQQAIAGFRQCATLAGHFQLPDVFDFVVVSLSQATGLLSDSLPTQVPNYPVVEVEEQSVTVSSLSVQFGTNFKGQLAAVILFNIVNGNGNALREGWTQIFEMFLNLFFHSLLPTRMLQMEDFLGGVTMIPLQGSPPPQGNARAEGSGLLSALSSYLMTPYGSPAEAIVPTATDPEVENTLCTIDCITSCRLDELYSQILYLEPEALVAAVKALEALAHERTVARLKQETDEETHETQAGASVKPLPYDPASIFLLETMASIACQTPQYIGELWPILFEHLSALLSASEHYSVLLIERAVVVLLRLCRILAAQPAFRDQIYVSFDLLSGLPKPVLNSVAEQTIAGLLAIINAHPDIARSQTEWHLVFALIRSTSRHPEASRLSFEMISQLCQGSSGISVTSDNVVGLFTVLDDFASVGSMPDTSPHAPKRRPSNTINAAMTERGLKSIDMLFDLKKHLQAFLETSSLGTIPAWRHFALPLLSSLARQSTHTAREIRHNAIGQLQKLLLGPFVFQTEVQSEQIDEIFNRVVFPLIDELLKPHVMSRDPQGMSETRLRASALLCKTFMHLEIRESQMGSDIRVLWIQILDLLDRLMNLDRKDQLYEAVPESLKNMILVMHASEFLVPPPQQSENQRTLWSATQERLERFLPGFLLEIIPPQVDATPTVVPQNQ